MRKLWAVCNIVVAVTVTGRILYILTGYGEYSDIVEKSSVGFCDGGLCLYTQSGMGL